MVCYQTEFPKNEKAAVESETEEITEMNVPDPAGAGGPADASSPMADEVTASADGGEEEVMISVMEPDIELLYEPDGDQQIERVDVDTTMRELREWDEKLDEELMKNNDA